MKNNDIEISNSMSCILNGLDFPITISLLGMPAALFFVGKIPKNCILRRSFSSKNIRVDSIPEVIEYEECTNIQELFNGKAKKTIDNFISILSSKDNIKLDKFYNNIKTLKIKKNKNDKTATSMAHYNKIDNSVLINRFLYLYHELLHVASSITINGKIFSGFSYGYLKPLPFYIGKALTEGYTQLLTERYFTSKRENCYPIEKHYASIIENIVGKEKMEQLYFEANLHGLIEELKEYEVKENIITFIRSMDFVSRYIYTIKDSTEIKHCKKAFDNINNFVISCYINKTIKTYTCDNNINKKQVIHNITNYIKDIKLYKRFNKKILNKLILELNFSKEDIDTIIERTVK